MGGGTAGASAGISAAKQGANTLVLEYLHGLGGLSTLGMIGVYWDGFRGGYTAHIDKSVLAMAPKDHPRQPKGEGRFPADWKMEWHRKELLQAGGKLWFGVMGCGALIEGSQVKGVVVATPFGRGVILSKILIDSTGSADIAIAAGAAFDYTGKKNNRRTRCGNWKMGAGRLLQQQRLAVRRRHGYSGCITRFCPSQNKTARTIRSGQIPQTRERRRVIGEPTSSRYTT